MPLNFVLDDLLKRSGYVNHCFISYPRASEGIIKCAQRIRDEIASQLSDFITEPKVFLDTRAIQVGHDWEKTLHCSLCKSITMVAICAPVYYDPGHGMCGREWAAMEALSEKRLPREQFSAIIPLIYRETDPLPSVSARIQYIDMSGASMIGQNYFKSSGFRKIIGRVVKQIEMVAEALSRCEASAVECDDFEFPDESAFGSYVPPVQPAPFRSQYA